MLKKALNTTGIIPRGAKDYPMANTSIMIHINLITLNPIINGGSNKAGALKLISGGGGKHASIYETGSRHVCAYDA